MDIRSVPGEVGVDDGIGAGDAGSIVDIGLAGALLGDGAAVAGIEATGLGLAGRIVMPGIGAIVDCADGAPAACLGTTTASAAMLMMTLAKRMNVVP